MCTPLNEHSVQKLLDGTLEWVRKQDDVLEQLIWRERERAMAEARLPDPALIYRKAAIDERRRVEERAMRPIAIVERAAWVLTAAAGAGLMAWNVPVIESWRTLVPSELPTLAPASAIVLFALSVFLFVSWLVFAEE